jgi:hypothetical protein
MGRIKMRERRVEEREGIGEEEEYNMRGGEGRTGEDLSLKGGE